jgi:hypothetical protein
MSKSLSKHPPGKLHPPNKKTPQPLRKRYLKTLVSTESKKTATFFALNSHQVTDQQGS